jgi:DNA topoisomerase-1
MLIAQQLYEGLELGGEGSVGLITYMRTDSVRVASEAQKEARDFISSDFGNDLAPQKVPVYKSKKSAQEAHEAIRPTSIIRKPQEVKNYLTRDQFTLYTLIWNRFLASQMSPALIEQTSVDITAEKYLFRATGMVVTFPGFMTLYTETPDEAAEEEKKLPLLKEGDGVKKTEILPKQHFTQPPPRYTEATLVKELPMHRFFPQYRRENIQKNSKASLDRQNSVLSLRISLLTGFLS